MINNTHTQHKSDSYYRRLLYLNWICTVHFLVILAWKETNQKEKQKKVPTTDLFVNKMFKAYPDLINPYSFLGCKK